MQKHILMRRSSDGNEWRCIQSQVAGAQALGYYEIVDASPKGVDNTINTRETVAAVLTRVEDGATTVIEGKGQ